MRRLVKLLLAGLAGVVVGWLLPGLARADVGEWSSAGPPEAITAVAVAVDPTHDQHVLAAGAGGATWTRIGSTPVSRALVVDRSDPATVDGIAAGAGPQRRTATMFRRT